MLSRSKPCANEGEEDPVQSEDDGDGSQATSDGEDEGTKQLAGQQAAQGPA